MFLTISTKTGALLKNIFGWDDLFNFLEDITSWACLFKSGLNYIFHLSAHSDIFCISLFSSYTEMLLLRTTENKEKTSANSFTVETKSSERSLM